MLLLKGAVALTEVTPVTTFPMRAFTKSDPPQQ